MRKQKTLGFIIAVVAGFVALLAFFALPFISSNFRPYTGITIATQSPGGIPLFWIVAGVAGAVIMIAGVQMFRGQGNDMKDVVAGRVAAWCSIELAGFILLILLGLYAYIISNIPLSASNGDGIGFGFWTYVLAMISVIVGGMIALVNTPVSRPSLQPQQWQQPQLQPQVWTSPQQWLPTQPAPQWPPMQPGPPSLPPQPWMQPQQRQPIQSALSPQQWPPSQRSQFSPQWPPTQQQPPRQ
jgi:phosphoglycerol transferase MdoB-like AlkP superfamily enzyme